MSEEEAHPVHPGFRSATGRSGHSEVTMHDKMHSSAGGCRSIPARSGDVKNSDASRLSDTVGRGLCLIEPLSYTTPIVVHTKRTQLLSISPSSA